MARRSPALFALLLILASILFVTPASAQTEEVPSFVMVTWNIQSGQSDPDTIAEQMALFDGVDIWLLQEVNEKETGYYRAGAEDGEGSTYSMVMSSSGDGNHLLTVWNADRFTVLKTLELAQINTTGNARPALVVLLRDNDTGVAFAVMNNHLYSSRPEERLRQATLLAQWAQAQSVPLFAGGDMNFEANSSDSAYVAMTAGGQWERIVPENDGPTRPNGRAIDHIFVSGPALEWPISTQIVERENDLDNEQNSDHRPVIALVGPEVAAPVIPCSTLSQSCLLQPGAEPTIAARLTSATSTATVTAATVNLRSGAGTSFPIAGSAKAGDVLTVTGRNADGSWLQLASGAWIAAFLVNTNAGTVAPTAAPTIASRTGGSVGTATIVPTPQPAAIPATATSEPPPVAAAGALVIIKVDKDAEYVVIRNNGGASVDLSGWVLLSEKGAQACGLGGMIEPGATLTISALGDIAGYNCGFGSNIWNNSERDPAALIAPDGSVVSYFIN